MFIRALLTALIALLMLPALAAAQPFTQAQRAVFARIIRWEDERNYNPELEALLKHRQVEVRLRAAAAMGRIGDQRGVKPLLDAINFDPDWRVPVAAAFALGEIEDLSALPSLVHLPTADGKPVITLRDVAAQLGATPQKHRAPLRTEPAEYRSRVIEAVGKIAGLPANRKLIEAGYLERTNRWIIEQLPDSQAAPTADARLRAELAMTALARIRLPASVGPLAGQLKSRDAEVRAQAANALFRSRLPLGEAVPALLAALGDADAEVRANSARALGESKDAAVGEQLTALLADPHEHVQVNTVRALANFKQPAIVTALLTYGEPLLDRYTAARTPGAAQPAMINRLLEVATAVGRIGDATALPFVQRLRAVTGLGTNYEVEIALAQLDAKAFLASLADFTSSPGEWRSVANVAQGLGEINSSQSGAWLVKFALRAEPDQLDPRAVPEVLRALAKIKHDRLPDVLRAKLKSPDVVVRAAAASLLAETPGDEATRAALIAAYDRAKPDRMNDAKLAILAALARQRGSGAQRTLERAMSDEDHLVRRRAAELLRQFEVDQAKYEPAIGLVKTGHDEAYYQRLARHLGQSLRAVIETRKGAITIELFANDAPMTVENFIQLSRKGFFNGLTFHRVVPNFVVQAGDPRGDMEGGPDYQIRCEINRRPYGRGAVGMALSGKDTGGSQFFITHSPQPHLDGGYTVFGQVIAGMDVVDRLTRGDVMERVTISGGH